MESTTGYPFNPCVGSFTSPGIVIDISDRRDPQILLHSRALPLAKGPFNSIDLKQWGCQLSRKSVTKVYGSTLLVLEGLNWGGDVIWGGQGQ